MKENTNCRTRSHSFRALTVEARATFLTFALALLLFLFFISLSLSNFLVSTAFELLSLCTSSHLSPSFFFCCPEGRWSCAARGECEQNAFLRRSNTSDSPFLPPSTGTDISSRRREKKLIERLFSSPSLHLSCPTTKKVSELQAGREAGRQGGRQRGRERGREAGRQGEVVRVSK